MKVIDYGFVELDSEKSFSLLAKNFSGVFRNNAVTFDNKKMEYACMLIAEGITAAEAARLTGYRSLGRL